MLSDEAFKWIWAKLSSKDASWLPLSVHMSDASGVAEHIWNDWLSESVRTLVSESMRPLPEDEIIKFVCFLAAAHDVGKASPAFQVKASSSNRCDLVERVELHGLRIGSYLEVNAIRHATISMAILEREGFDRSISVIIGGHHGVTPAADEIRERKLRAYASNTGFEDDSWVAVQRNCMDYAIRISGVEPNHLRNIRLPSHVQDILTGIVIMSDWVASNELLFPLIPYDDCGVSDRIARVDSGWQRMRFPHHRGLVYGSEKTFSDAFGFEPKAFQSTAMDVARTMSEPGMMVIEAPMGEGKTEAALAIAEIWAHKFGQNGLFFGLPTQATANGIFARVNSWVRQCSGEGERSIMLAHGSSAFSQEFKTIPRTGWNVDGGRENVIVHEWFHGKTAMLSDIVVGTVDQVLMAGLKQKHLSMRHLGLAEKIVIIDECHAYDEYMGSYLCKALMWLGRMKVPVVVMSATLPPKRKTEMISAYSGGRFEIPESTGYPLITCVSGDDISSIPSAPSGHRRDVAIRSITMDLVTGTICDMSSEGGYVGIIVNTVGHAQRLYSEVKRVFPEASVYLLHSAFTASDRAEKERDLIDTMRRRDSNGRLTIVIGTQVLEQSLDIDFDVMFSEICPIDLLLQRIGRLHRHDNIRPNQFVMPICFIIDSGEQSFDSGTEAVYGKYQLMNTRMLLNDIIKIPSDIPMLVNAAYSPLGVHVPDELRVEYERAKADVDLKMQSKEQKAKVFQIKSPDKLNDLVGWLDNQRNDPLGLCAEATVRDIDGSVEIILVRKVDDHFEIPVDPPVLISSDEALSGEVARMMATCRIRVPHRVLSYGVEKTIDSIIASNKELIPRMWYDSEWISDEIIQIMDCGGHFDIMGFKMRYDSEMGLTVDE